MLINNPNDVILLKMYCFTALTLKIVEHSLYSSNFTSPFLSSCSLLKKY